MDNLKYELNNFHILNKKKLNHSYSNKLTPDSIAS